MNWLLIPKLSIALHKLNVVVSCSSNSGEFGDELIVDTEAVNCTPRCCVVQ
jgi:hypothetical protein